MDKQTFKIGEAPWETGTETPKSFPVGQAPWETAPQEKPVSGLQSFVQGVASPFLKVASSVAALASAGDTEKYQKIQDEGIDFGYFGNARPVGAGFDVTKGLTEENVQAVKEAVGTGAEIASNIVGTGGAVKTVAKGLGGQVVKGLATGAGTGAVSGGLLGFGDALQEAESKPMDVAFSTIFGATAGGVLGGALGAVTPVAVKSVQTAKDFTGISTLEAKLADGFKRVLNPSVREIKADARFGGDSFRFLAQEMPDVPLQVNKDGKIVADEAIEMAKMKYAAESTAYKPIIRNSGKYIDIDEAVSKMKAQASKEFDGTDLIKAQQQIDDEVNAYLARTPQDVNVTADGKRFITLSRADDIKSYSWARGKGWGTPDAEVWNDTNNLIGHALKEAIEKELPNAPIKAMNKRLGQWKNAIDMLERRNLQTTGGSGKIGKLFNRSVSTLIGGTLGAQNDGGISGGLVGAGTGFMTAQAIASMLANPQVRLFAVRQLLQRLKKAGRTDMIEEAEKLLQEQASKYLLPAAGKSSYVETPSVISLPKSVRETNIGLDEVSGAIQNRTTRNPKTGTVYVKPAKGGKSKIIK